MVFFEHEEFPFRLLGVVYLDQTDVRVSNRGRQHSSLSFRFEADTVIETEHGQRLELGPGQVSFVPARLDYLRTAKRDRMIVIDFFAEAYTSAEFESFVPENPAKYEALFRQILRVWEEKETGYRFEAAALLNRILAQLYREAHTAADGQGRLAPAVCFLERNCLKKDFSLPDAAQAAGISDVYFRRLFHRRYGMSPKQYVIDRRMRHAVLLLEEGHHSLQEVADLCGYEDYKYFSVEFKRNVGMPPSHYAERRSD